MSFAKGMVEMAGSIARLGTRMQQEDLMAASDSPAGSPRALISSDRVQGTEVYGTSGEHIGTIENLVIDKITGRVVYAMMSFGGFLGLGKRLYPIPWEKLSYDIDEGGYSTDLTEEQVKNAPDYNPDASVDSDIDERLYDYYDVRGFWDGSEVGTNRRKTRL